MAKLTPYQAHGAIVEPTRESMNALAELITWAEKEVPRMLPLQMNKLVRMLALLNQGYARAMSFGPSDPTQAKPAWAWRIPVRRITERYYLGWKVRSLGLGAYELYNDSREAYYIEFGINWMGGARRVRRPIRKLSLRRTLESAMTTKLYDRIWADIYANPQNPHRGRGFTQIVQSPRMGSFTGPMLGRRLP